MVPVLKVLSWVAAGVISGIGLGFYGHVTSTRWNVKTLADSFELPKTVVTTTIAEQRDMKMPIVDENSPRCDGDRTLYRLRALLVDAATRVDGDYHLILEDPDTHLRMVAEIPDPVDPVPESFREKFRIARKTIDRLVGAKVWASSIQPKDPPLVEITGIGFFDVPHIFVPAGMASNYREIHPVITVTPLEKKDRSEK